MRDYGKVHTTFWTSTSVRELSEDGRTLAFYLLTCPHGTIAGVFRLPDGYVCEDLQWASERVQKGFAELFRNGFANRCETTKWVWILKHLDWNPPENPNQRKAIAKVVTQIPAQCHWKLDFMRVCGPSLGFGEVPKTNPFETLSKPFLNQEQEQEQEQEIGESAQARPPSRKRASALPEDFEPNETGLAYAQQRGVNLPTELQSFCNHHRAKGTTLKDWQAGWRTWCDKAVEFGRVGGVAGRGGVRSVALTKSFAQQEREAGWAKWERMTGREHPDRMAADCAMRTVVEAGDFAVAETLRIAQ